MGRYTKMEPLTSEEQAFATENYSTLIWCMKSLRLDQNDYSDLAALAFLLAVKKWYLYPDLHQWSFKTVARQTIRSRISNERQKETKRIQTLSLDAVIPGTDDITYAETVTYSNMEYLKEGAIMNLNYDVEFPKDRGRGRPKSEEILELEKFLLSDHETMCFEYESAKEAAAKRETLRKYQKRKDNDRFVATSRENKIYIKKRRNQS